MSNHRIAICVGHSRLGDKGAVSVGNVAEWNFNLIVANEVRRLLALEDVDAKVWSAYPRNTYGAAMTWLGAELRKDGATAAIELHFNSAENDSARGHEWLHWHTSRDGRKLAGFLEVSMASAFPNRKRRGLVSIPSEAKRGGGFLRRTPCPAVVCEPFFGSNREEWELFSEHRLQLAEAIATGILAWIHSQEKGLVL